MNDENRWGAVIDHEKAWLGGSKGLYLGDYYAYTVKKDLKHVGFTLSRYKFVSKLVAYREKIHVLELGCNEGLGAEMIRQNTDMERYVGVDLDEKAIEWNRNNFDEKFLFIDDNFFDNVELKDGEYKSDLVVSLDVIEHIEPIMEDKFLEIIRKNTKDEGVAVIGTPNITMSPYASEASKIGHINLYDHRRLYELANRYFNNVFLFSMNDEIVYTGFDAMACYIFAVCTSKK